MGPNFLLNCADYIYLHYIILDLMACTKLNIYMMHVMHMI